MSDELRALLTIETLRLTCTNGVAGSQCGTEIRLPVRLLGAGGRDVTCPGCGLSVDVGRFEAIKRDVIEIKNLCTNLLSPDLGHFEGQFEA